MFVMTMYAGAFLIALYREAGGKMDDEVDTVALVAYPLTAILNLIVFLAANKVRTAVKNGQE